MKITEQLEWDYETNKKTSTNFMTKDTIREIVAAELFIPIVEELYDKNIFTNWSGLTGNAHIRIPLDGLSKENFLISKKIVKVILIIGSSKSHHMLIIKIFYQIILLKYM